MYRTGSNRVKGHAVQVLSVDETPRRVRGRARVRCDAYGIEVWGPTEFEAEAGMLERGILAFACPTCGRGLVVDLVASKTPEELPRAAEASEERHQTRSAGGWDGGAPSSNQPNAHPPKKR